jgi:hypothetical protein
MVEKSMKPGRMVLLLLVLVMAARCSRQPAEPAPAAPHTPAQHAAAAPARVVQTALHHFARGAALAATGKAADAEAVFRADLDKHVGNPRSLYGLWRSLEAQRKPATDVKAQFDKAWAAADVALDDTLYPARR